MSKYDVAGTLKRLRAKSGMTADAIGQLVGRSGKTVIAWEHGNGQPDAEMLIKLSQIYHVDNMLEEFRSVEPQTSDDPICLSDHERHLILAYRKHPDRQNAVDILLGIAE